MIGITFSGWNQTNVSIFTLVRGEHLSTSFSTLFRIRVKLQNLSFYLSPDPFGTMSVAPTEGGLESLLGECGVPPAVTSSLILAGWT